MRKRQRETNKKNLAPSNSKLTKENKKKKKKKRPANMRMTEETLYPELREEEEEEDMKAEEGEEGKIGFHACYLLTSLCPRFKGHTYIGYTVNPRRRIRQHNGEIGMGAWRTKKRRPWEMVLCIYGFPTNVSALQFEWAWQHPRESLAVRQAAASFKSFSGVANKIKLAYTMLNLPAWQSLKMTVNYFSTKYTKDSASCPSLPEHMKVRVCPMDHLPCYTDGSSLDAGDAEEDEWDDEDEFEKASDGGASGIQETHCTDGFLSSTGMEGILSGGGTGEDGKDDLSTEGSNTNGQKERDAEATAPIPAGYGHSIAKASSQQFGWCGEHSTESSSPEVDRLQPFGFIDSLARTSFAMSTSSSQETTEADGLTSSKESGTKLDWLSGKDITSKAATGNNRQPVRSFIAPPEVEVIDLLSPSPLYCKKRRVYTVCPEIIDLT